MRLPLLSLLAVAGYTEAVEYWRYVKPLSGTAGGNMFPGVARPFGVVKLGVDVVNNGQDAYSGYLEHGSVTGFSMMHESGTGGAPKYGVVSQMPITGKILNPLKDLSVKRVSGDIATLGHYTTTLSNGVVVDLAASDHSGIYEYTFPGQYMANVVVDASHVLPSFRGQGLGQTYVKGNFKVFKDGHYEGSGTYRNGWNRAPDWTIHFCGYFDEQPSAVKVFKGTNQKLMNYGGIQEAGGSLRVGAVFTWKPTIGAQNNYRSNIRKIRSRVGISWISPGKACKFVQNEVPKKKNFDALVAETRNVWDKNVLSKIQTTDGNGAHMEQLYTSLYGLHLLPSNRTGENPNFKSNEPYYDDIFTFWDLWRSATPLIHVLQPKAYEEQIRSLIDIQRHEGYLPDARSSNFNGRTQGGSNADNVLADAFVKGVRGRVNWANGLDAMLKDAVIEPKNNHDPMAPDSSTKEGRGALPDWASKGYITTRFSRSVSRAVEYSINDFAISQVARGLGRVKVADKFLKRSRQWRNHWNPNAKALGFSGFLMPKDGKGQFIRQDPLECGACYWKSEYYEGLPWEYTFGPIHDVSELVRLSQGPQRFVDKLLTTFKPDTVPKGPARFGHTIFDPTNEPDFNTPYLFNYAGRQDLTVQIIRHVGEKFYGLGPASLPGNSDAGAMQSWILWNMIGIYPVATTTTFLIGSPWLSNMRIDLGAGKWLTINSHNVNPGKPDNHFVQSLKVNGKHWDKAWVDWKDIFANGGSMDFTLGTKRANWATGPLPPLAASEASKLAGKRVAAPPGGAFGAPKQRLFH